MELHATRIGDGPGRLVVFCHGVFGQGKNWTSIARALATDTDGPPHRSLLLDMPNHGRSGWSETMDYPTMADQVAAAIEAEPTRDDEPVALVGHSMGGKIAMHLTLRHPELVDRLCVVDISPVGYGSMRDFHRYVQAMSSLDLTGLRNRDQAETHLGENGVDTAGVRSFLLQNLRRDQQDGQVQWRWQPNLALIREAMAELGDWVEPTERAWPGPVLWVAGADSEYVRPEYAEAMHTLFPRTRLVTIKNAAHWVHADQPKIFTSVLRRFLDTP
ncbi:alpha/beta hydrolase [Enemella evansiae]|uniref:Alpha/beta hydrolase n=1 Tax=Enemella evansiae TaxID=2016499 RepID=A0A255GET2_9ACTN|nr:alpha/beta fold hydrolase [Enemella evansiae]OYO14367.1 alpha/beta hydrolase [Enemella evansiae]